ncbi:hypothetical protein NYR70_10825 [Actinobacillus equuli subsp. equuli]|uniref:Extracellular endo-alpha-(1->5)-L-arabinanase C-terminal domain-containing protein n=2 Tax=Actinobacillus equuli TaxID=718 RepID=A0A0A7MNP6_ACTEU|nr:hypothetical protein [Actinobacillus equuli]AIZ80361.1 hypothetical protein ACEE_11515 [Actinobacillus equuli subsp. equuli]MDE8034057.1 hypothetical protein [Actinobacillus equuli subsp. equuli]MDG4949239.1 hypothetical protein [Actinobacillus equuli subsp. haemolyticus]MDG4953603.1 hypothetical protein [Actinobacillus equuli subsp. equuli]WGE44465.1 hypothetical protein NYR65_11390 [Actinobacillus equuli subsp. equuli]
MNKIFLATAVALLSACTTYTTSNAPSASREATIQSFIGEWECRMDGGSIATSNKVKLSQDGKATYLGKMVLPNDNPIFSYDINRNGTWNYANHTLTYKFTQGSVTRAHTDEIQQALKMDKELNSSEKQYYNALSKQMTKKSNPINLAVSNFAQNSFTIQQKVGNTARTGHCVRPTN